MREALRDYGQPVLLLTITAPGSSVLPLDVHGQCCERELSEWAARMVGQWQLLRNYGSKAVRRSKPDSTSGPVVLAYAWQLQRRGAPHLHVIVPAGAVGRAFASAVKASARDYGFGFVDIKTSTGSALAAALYLSRYVARDIGSGRTRHLPLRSVFVSRELCRRAGVGIRIARRVRHLWVFANLDRSAGLPRFTSDCERDWVFYWYRVGRRGRENIPRPGVAFLG